MTDARLELVPMGGAVMDMDLSLVPTDDLWHALKIRFDHAVFGGFRETGTGNDEEQRYWTGHAMFCVALAMELVRALQDYEREKESGC